MIAFSRLPGVGPKAALRYILYLLKLPKSEIETMARALVQLAERIKICSVCFTYTERDICDICEDPKRDSRLLCVVEEARDIATIEATKHYQGRYHVLHGTLNPIEGITPETLRMKELIERIKNHPTIQEIILAFSSTVQGETTILYLAKVLAPLGKRVTRLARGLPVGATLEFADEITLADAIEERRIIS